MVSYNKLWEIIRLPKNYFASDFIYVGTYLFLKMLDIYLYMYRVDGFNLILILRMYEMYVHPLNITYNSRNIESTIANF